MKKQTAVEMIFESFFDMKWEDMQDWQKPVIFLQAKEMEKEQMCDFVEYCGIEYSKYQETESSWIKELTIDDLFEKRHTNKQ